MADLAERVHRYWAEAWTQGRTEYLHEFYTPTFRENEELLTPAELATHLTSWRLKFPDFAATVDRTFTSPGMVTTRVVYTGTHLGDFAALPATGRSFRSSGLDVFEFVDGRVVQHWHETDHYDLFLQLGAAVVPA